MKNFFSILAPRDDWFIPYLYNQRTYAYYVTPYGSIRLPYPLRLYHIYTFIILLLLIITIPFIRLRIYNQNKIKLIKEQLFDAKEKRQAYSASVSAGR